MTNKPDISNSSEEYAELYNSFLNILNGFAYCRMIYKNGKAHDFTYLKVNKAFEDLTGLKNVEGKNVSEVIPGIQNSDQKLIELYGKVATTVVPEKFEIYLETLGEWFSVTVQSPKTDYFVAVFDVITKRKKLELGLIENESRFRTLADTAPVLIWQSGTDAMCNYFNKPWLDFTGRTMEQEIGNGWAEGVHPDDLQRCLDIYLGSFKANEPFKMEYRLRNADGEYRWVTDNGVPMFSSDGIFAGYIGSCVDITERKTTEDKLRYSELNLYAVFNCTDEAIYLISADEEILDLNNEAARRIGKPRKELIGLKVMNLLPPDVVAHRKPYLDKVLKGDNVMFEDKRNGRWVLNHLYPIFDSKGKVNRIVVFSRDINDIKLANDAVKESEARFKNMFANHNSIMLLINPDNGAIIEANKSASEFYGYSIRSLCDMHINSINTLSDEEIAVEMNKAKLDKRNHFIFPHRLANGENRIVEVHSSPIFYENKVILFSIIHDITERRKAEDALTESEERYRNLFETEKDALFVIDKENFEILEANNSACELYGYSKEEMLKMKNYDLSAEPEETKRVTINLKNRIDLRYHKKKDGSVFPVDISSSEIQYKGKPSIIAAIRDITKRVNDEKILVHQNEELQRINAEKDRFFSIIAHDLRSPFTGFIGLTQLMSSDFDTISLSELNKIAYRLHQSANNIYGLLTNLLEWAKMQRGITLFKPEKLLIKTITDEAIDISKETAAGKNIEIINNVEAGILLQADKAMLETIMRNLISNALKFTGKGGRVIVSSNAINDNVDISVKDSGIGMSKELINELFRIDKKTGRLGTDKEPSSGLGLLLCKEFVEKHNGTIRIKSEEGKGSEFIISFPSTF